jgi:hypothetical protein
MKNKHVGFLVLVILLLCNLKIISQIAIEAGDPPNNTNIPGFYKSKLTDIDQELEHVQAGNVESIATSPGGLPVHAVYYGEKEDFQSQANYNSAIGARNPAYYAKKSKEAKPVIFFIGPVHGQEAEGIVGLINLIHIAETGKDHRGKEWQELNEYFKQCRVIIIPCGNPDGRKRCPYDSFVGLPVEIMTKYGQGTRRDGTSWGWPLAKSLHPMKDDAGILGAYFNNNGINIMHDDFFFPMAEETKSILKIARNEAPDMTVSLHSHAQPPFILQPAYVPFFIKEKVAVLANNLNKRYQELGLPYMDNGWQSKANVDGSAYPLNESFNLISALHHISGTMAFTFECSHGVSNFARNKQEIDYNTILDIQLTLYQEMFRYLLANKTDTK